MRIRSTKPEFWRSERIADLSWDARLVLKGLESYVDDNGVGKDDVALIVGDVFPRDMVASPRETVARVSEAVSELHRTGFIHRYKADGTRLLYVSWWDSTQRIDKPSKGRFPRPDGTMNYRDSEIRDSLASPPERVAPGTEEQRNRGTEEQTCPPASQPDADASTVVPSSPRSTRRRGNEDPPDFSAFWEIYPRRESRKAAVASFVRARKTVDLETILAGVRRYAEATRGNHTRHIAHASTWLNNERWNDELNSARNGASRGQSGESAAQSIHDMGAELTLEAEEQESR